MISVKRKKAIFLISILISISILIPFFVLDPSYARGDIVDYTGLDGCSYVLISEGEAFEIVNYDGPEKNDVHVYYYSSTDGLSFCMVGQVIHILFVSW